MYLSIDFEDFHHDLKRTLGLPTPSILKSDALWEKYLKINELLDTKGKEKGKFATFFCTGVIADKEPDLIRRIAADGHEIACHYYYHDFMRHQDLAEVEVMLEKARNSLEDVSNSQVVGFRAPNFAIDKVNPNQYQAVEKIFTYDSSFFCSSVKELENFKHQMGLRTLELLPIYSKRILGKNLRLGGTFLKLFPAIYSKWMFSEAEAAGFSPHVYLHPYEFGVSEQFRVTSSELMELGLKESIYWSFRQLQWLSIRNSSVEKKLSSLLETSPFMGRLCDTVKA
jgi:hypothetical protein